MAVVMGSATFGKATIQVTAPLTGGAGLMLTVARYYAPTGRSIQNVGVQPDLPVDDHPPDHSGDLPAVREIDLDRHLSSQAGRPDTALEQTHAREVTGQLQTIEAQRAQSSNPSVGRRPTTQPVVYWQTRRLHVEPGAELVAAQAGELVESEAGIVRDTTAVDTPPMHRRCIALAATETDGKRNAAT
ncbi:S41 family peptidase [Paraburkholderia sp. A1RI_3L]|uniref:S41 family peptidase n=1 Tax=Paraburkholderia kururiensis TaxID=984307 RepID=UPI003B7E83C3